MDRQTLPVAVRSAVTHLILQVEAAVGPRAHLLAAPICRRTSDDAALVRLFKERTATASPTDAEVAAYYRRNPDRWHWAAVRVVRHILVRDEATALHLARSLAAGADFVALASRWSVDRSSRDRGGLLGPIERGDLFGTLADVIFDCPVGTDAGPTRTEFGWHLVRVESEQVEVAVPLVEVEVQIRAELSDAMASRSFASWLQQTWTEVVRLQPLFDLNSPAVMAMTHRH